MQTLKFEIKSAASFKFFRNILTYALVNMSFVCFFVLICTAGHYAIKLELYIWAFSLNYDANRPFHYDSLMQRCAVCTSFVQVSENLSQQCRFTYCVLERSFVLTQTAFHFGKANELPLWTFSAGYLLWKRKFVCNTCLLGPAVSNGKFSDDILQTVILHRKLT